MRRWRNRNTKALQTFHVLLHPLRANLNKNLLLKVVLVTSASSPTCYAAGQSKRKEKKKEKEKKADRKICRKLTSCSVVQASKWSMSGRDTGSRLKGMPSVFELHTSHFHSLQRGVAIHDCVKQSKHVRQIVGRTAVCWK